MARITGAENSIINRVVKNSDPAELLARIAQSNQFLKNESERQAKRDVVLQQRNANKGAQAISPTPALPTASAFLQEPGLTEQNFADEVRRAELERLQQAQLEELRRIAIENEAAYATTVEQADEIEKRRKAAEAKLNATRDALRNIDPESIEYLGRERIANTVKGYGGQWLGSQASSLGTILAGGNALQEASSEKDRAINDSLYSGWVTDELTRQNFAEAGPESAGVLEENREAAQKVLDYADRTADRSGKQIMMAKENLGLGGQLAVDLGGQAIQIGLDALTRLPNLSLASRSFGGGAQEARQEGKDVGTQFIYGALQGAKEFALNKALGGISKVYGKSAVGKAFDGAFNKIIKNPVLASALDRVFNTEGIEEGLSALLDPAAKALAYKDVGLGEAYSELEIEDVLYNAAVGQLMGVLGGGEPRQQPQNAMQAEAAQNAPQQTQTAPLQETAPTAAEAIQNAPAALNSASNTDTMAQVMELLAPGISNRQAETIITNPQLAAAFESLPDAPELKGGKSQQRATVKASAETLANNQQAQGAKADPAQLLADTALRGTGAVTANGDTQGPETATVNNAPLQQNIDNTANQTYNNINDTLQTGGTNNDTGRGFETDRAGIPGVQAGRSADAESRRGPDAARVGSGLVLLSEESTNKLQERGVYVPVKNGPEYNAAFSAALGRARAADPINGWAVTWQTAEDIAAKGAIPFLSEDGNAGFIVSKDGDIQGVFANKAEGAPKGVSRSLIPLAIANGGTKLDCYGEPLVRLYSKYGFVPVARVKFNPEFANDGWTPDKGQPDIYFMMYTGDGADAAVENYGKYPTITPAELNALPVMEYDEAENYRETLLASQASRNKAGQHAAKENDAMVERGYTQNVRDSEYTEAALAQDLEENKELYIRLSNRSTLEKAKAIFNGGFAQAYVELTGALKNAQNGSKLAPEMVPLSRMVANELARQGRIDEAHEITAGIAAELTAAGQLGQAGAILSGADPAAKAEAIRKMVDKLNNSLTKGQKRQNIKEGAGTETGRIKVDDALIAEYANAETDEARDAVLDKITSDIARQLPATFMEKWNALRYTAMLGNLKTQGRNIIGNAMFGLEAAAKRRVQALFELAYAKIKKGEYQPTVSFSASKQLISDAKADFENVADVIGGQRKYSEAKAVQGAIQDKRPIFKTKLLEKYRLWTKDTMEWGDRIFLRFHYVDSLSTYLQAHGVKSISEASPELLENARNFAIKEAQEATFRDKNAVSEFASTFGRARPRADGTTNPVAKGAEILTEGVIPFRATPANVLVRGEEYSPLGIANAIINRARAQKGSIDTAEAINSAAKATTGTTLFLAGAAMALAGAARGTEDDEKLAEFQAMQGKQDWSITIADVPISVAQFAPAAVPFAVGIELAEMYENGGGFSLDTFLAILGAVSDPMLEMSMLQGLNDALENTQSYGSDSKALPLLITNALTQYLIQVLIPSGLRQLEQLFEKNRQTVYTDNNNAIDRLLGKQQYAVGKALGGIPGVDYHQQDYIDAWGRTQSNGSFAERAFNAFLNPTYYGKDRSTEVDAELERLYAATKDIDGLNVLPQRPGRGLTVDGEKLSPEEYMQYAKDKGQYSLEMVKDFMASDLYKSLEGKDELRAQIISDLYEYAGKYATAQIQENRGAKAEDNFIFDLKKPAEYVATRAAFNSFVDTRNYTGIDALLETARGLEPKAYKAFAESNGAKNLLEAEKAGVGSQAFYNVIDIANAAKDRRYGSNTSDADILFGIGKADISNRDKDAIAKVLLGESNYSYYEKARDAGYSATDAANIYSRADANGKNGVSQAEMDSYIQRTGASSEEAERLWALFGWSTPYSRYRPK